MNLVAPMFRSTDPNLLFLPITIRLFAIKNSKSLPSSLAKAFCSMASRSASERTLLGLPNSRFTGYDNTNLCLQHKFQCTWLITCFLCRGYPLIAQPHPRVVDLKMQSRESGGFRQKLGTFFGISGGSSRPGDQWSQDSAFYFTEEVLKVQKWQQNEINQHKSL